jgi:ribonuclease HI
MKRNLPIGIAVDASAVPNPGFVEYRGVDIQSGKVLFNTKIGYSSNNVGEYCAIVQALIYCEKAGKHITIWSDSRTALAWIYHKQTKSKVKSCPDATALFRECERYVDKMKYVHHIKFWDKKIYGEIPADYGRK